MRSRLRFLDMLRLSADSLKQNPVRLVVTAFLASVALMLFGASLCMALYRADVAVAHAAYEKGDASLVITESGYVTEEDVAAIKEATGIELYGYFIGDYATDWNEFFVPDSVPISDTVNRGTPGKFCALTDASAFSVTGRLPEKAGEIAISVCFLNAFLESGAYYDHIASPMTFDWDALKWIYDEAYVSQVSSADDVIGKNVYLYGEVAEIVGVVDYGECPHGHSYLSEIGEEEFDLYDTIFISEADAARIAADECGGGIGMYLIADEFDSYAETLSLVQYADSNEAYTFYSKAAEQVHEYEKEIGKVQAAFLIFGAVLAFFSALLIFQFISMSIDAKRKEVGVLRALGARGSDVAGIFLLENLLLALLYALIASPLTYLASSIVNSYIGTSLGFVFPLLNFNALVPLSITALSLIISFIAVIAPIARLLKIEPIAIVREFGE